MSLKHERSKCEIIYDMLKAIQDEKGVRKTRIMQRAYLDWRMFKKYFKYLLEGGFIIQTPEMELGTSGCYILNPKGKALLKRLDEIDSLMNIKDI